MIAPDLLGHGARTSRAPTTRSPPTPTACATCSACSASTGHRGRPLARRRRGHAVRLPVSRALRAAGAGQRGRCGPRGQPRPAGRSRCRAPTCCSPRCGCPACAGQSASSPRLIELLDTDLGRDADELLRLSTPCPTPPRAAPSSAPCARSSTGGARSSPCSTAATSPRACRPCCCGDRPRQRDPGRARVPRTRRCPAAGSRSSRAPGHFPFHSDPARFLRPGRGLRRDDPAGRLEYGALARTAAGGARGRE